MSGVSDIARSTGGCPDENVLVQLAHGGIESPSLRASLQAHLDGCASCRQLVAAVAGGSAPLAPQSTFAALEPGTTLGRYKVERLIGAGGMGVLYVAHDIRLDRRVALKLMHPSQDDAAGKARLWREAQAMARLSHPNVVNVFDLGEYEGQLFVAMELVEGGTLADHIRAERTWRESLDILTAAGDGLAAAHRAGVVHRDFKPDNVMLGHDGRPRVADFGLARPGEPRKEQLQALATGPIDITRTGMMLGTPAYMSPEQLLRQPADARSDQYSFCVTLYEALYGKRPFEGGSFDEVRAKVVKGVLSRPATPSVPEHVWQALARGLSVDPAHRFESMDALLRALRTPRSVFAERRVRIGLVAGLLLALGGGATGALLGTAQRPTIAPVVLTISSNPKTRVLVVKPSGGRLDLGEVPIDRAKGAEVGDTVVMSNEELGIHFEDKIANGPDANRVLFKDFVTGKLKVLVSSAPARGLSVWRGNQQLSSNPNATLELYEGTHRLELRGEALRAPVPFEVQIKPREVTTATVDIASAYVGSNSKAPVETAVATSTPLDLAVGQTETLLVEKLVRLAIGDTAVAEVKTLGGNKVEVTARGAGNTSLLAWTSDGRRTSWEVRVREDYDGKKYALELREGEMVVLPGTYWIGGTATDSKVASAQKLGDRFVIGGVHEGTTDVSVWDDGSGRIDFAVHVLRAEKRTNLPSKLNLPPGAEAAYTFDAVAGGTSNDPRIATVERLGAKSIVVKAKARGRTFIIGVIGTGGNMMEVTVGDWPLAK